MMSKQSLPTKPLSNDMNIHNMFTSKHYDFQKLLFGEIVFDEEYNKTKKKTPAYICMYTYIKFVCVFV